MVFVNGSCLDVILNSHFVLSAGPGVLEAFALRLEVRRIDLLGLQLRYEIFLLEFLLAAVHVHQFHYVLLVAEEVAREEAFSLYLLLHIPPLLFVVFNWFVVSAGAHIHFVLLALQHPFDFFLQLFLSRGRTSTGVPARLLR